LSGLTFEIQPVKASGTIYIRADGSIDPPTAPISSFDNVTYTFTDNIYGSIVIERSNIIIDGNRRTLQGPGSGTGISLSGRENVTIKNTNIKNNYNGIRLDSSSSNTISGNNITANSWSGIYLGSSSSNTISGNNITNNENGVLLGSSSGNSISGNTFTNDGLFVYYSYQNSVENNTVNGRPLVYLEGVSNHTVDDAGQVILVRCENIRVEGLNLSRTSVGVELWETSNSTISGNNITNSVSGIHLYYSSNYNSISGNNITNNRNGIQLDSSSNCSISGNNITNSGSGIYLGSSSNYNSISGNNITANNWHGIYLGSSSNYNSISGNNIANNWHGIRLYSSSGNKIYHNNFANNTQQVYSYDSINVWDNGYPSGGNYWSNYTGVDLHSGSNQNETGGDSIGDTPHVIDENNTDCYPLMAPYSTFDAGTWNALAYNVEVVSNSTVSGFQFNPSEGASLRFNVTGDDGTSGFCRVTIPKDLLWVEDGQWIVLVEGVPITNYTITPDENCAYLHFNYNHSTKTVQIQGTHAIPEFPSFLILPLFFIATLLAVIVYRKKHAKISGSP
jgi:parallel beta-helix repeat protein